MNIGLRFLLGSPEPAVPDPKVEVLVTQSGPTLFDPLDCIARQAPLSMGFSRQEYWSGLPFPSPGHLPNPGIEPGSPALQADSLPSEPPGRPSVPDARLHECPGLVPPSPPCLSSEVKRGRGLFLAPPLLPRGGSDLSRLELQSPPPVFLESRGLPLPPHPASLLIPWVPPQP